MSFVKSECVIHDLVNTPFLRRSISEKNEIIKIGKPCLVIPNLTSVYKDKTREYIRHFNTLQYDNTIRLTGFCASNKLYCWPCLLCLTENGVWSKNGFNNLNTLSLVTYRHEKLNNHIKYFFQLNTFGRTDSLI